MKKFNLFPTTVMEFDFSNHPNLPLLMDYINDVIPHLNEHGIIDNGISSYNLMRNFLSSPNLIELKNDFQKSVDYYSRELNIFDSIIDKSWFNILDLKGKVSAHHHNSSIISGAFYPLLKEGSCDLYFKSPLYTALNFESKNLDTEHFQKDFKMHIKQNHLYTFPGWLIHYTEENRSDQRIVVSFNTKYI